MGLRWTEDELIDFQKRRGIQTVDQKKPVKKKPKYNNEHPWIDGICFDSLQEAEYYNSLKLLCRAGAIKGFCRQPQFILVEGNEQDRAITYSADYIIFKLDGSAEIVDVKGMETEQWKRTFKQFRLKFPLLELKIVKE